MMSTDVAGYLAGVFYPDLISRSFSVKPSSGEVARAASGIRVNIPRVVSPVDDSQEFYSVQASIALEIDAGTAALIRARHEVIDRHLVELLHTYRLQDLRFGGQRSTLRKDIKRVIGALLLKGQVRNVYVTNWLIIPAGY